MSQEILRVEHLKKYFDTPRGKLHAVDNVGFTLNAGKTLGVVGESGCGKSTLGRTVLGLTSATDGKIFFQGEDITFAKGHARRELQKKMQIIFQDPFSSLNPRYTVFELIANPIRTFRLCRGKAETERKVFELMDTVGLARRFAYAYPHELDGGRRQRIGIARALALEPRFIVCDEPVSALDVSIQAQILNLFRQLQQELGLAYLFIGHGLGAVNYVSDRIAVMYLGQLVEIAEAKELFRNPVHPYTRALCDAVPVPDPDVRGETGITLSGEVSSRIQPGQGCRFRPRCPFACPECDGYTGALEPIAPGSDHLSTCRRGQKEEG